MPGSPRSRACACAAPMPKNAACRTPMPRTVLAAMAADPKLIERPLVETDKGVRLCRPQEKVLRNSLTGPRPRDRCHRRLPIRAKFANAGTPDLSCPSNSRPPPSMTSSQLAREALPQRIKRRIKRALGPVGRVFRGIPAPSGDGRLDHPVVALHHRQDAGAGELGRMQAVRRIRPRRRHLLPPGARPAARATAR